MRANNKQPSISKMLPDFSRFYTPLVSDTMERMGMRSPALDSSVQDILPDPSRKVWGYAFPCRVVPTEEYVEITTLLEMVDSIPRDAFVVVAADAPVDAALWGGMMSARARARGAVAAVVNGGVRDIEQIAQLRFPVFGTGRCIQDIRRRGYMAAYNVPVAFGRQTIHPGDLIFADANGVVRIPADQIDAVHEELTRAFDEEASTQTGLVAGKDARELFDRYGRF